VAQKRHREQQLQRWLATYIINQHLKSEGGGSVLKKPPAGSDVYEVVLHSAGANPLHKMAF
jgi:hypothetical protein